MNNSPFKVIWLKAAIAFLIPLLAGFGGMFSQYELSGLPLHWKIVLIVTICSALTAAISALASFLSTSFAEHKAKVEAGVDDADPAPITAAQVSASPIPIIVPSNKPIETMP